MKRFHVHLTVDDLDTNIAFYRQLFGQPPTRQEAAARAQSAPPSTPPCKAPPPTSSRKP
jgi:catechol 2,3-dioxygenase-like lactoylglutathione lyase family enzyme